MAEDVNYRKIGTRLSTALAVTGLPREWEANRRRQGYYINPGPIIR